MEIINALHHHQVPNQTRVLRQLSVDESLYLLGTVSLGRIVFTHKALPAIRPVNHIVHNGDVIIRSHAGAAVLSSAAQGVVVAYQADAIDPRHHIGWSVVVTGVARRVVDAEDIARFQDRLRPWIDEPAMDQVIRVHTDLVTGFELASA